MTDEALVHFWPTDNLTPCGASPISRAVGSWSEVTCPGCRLEQPMDTRGNPERGLAPEVSRRLLAERLAKIAAVEDEALEEIRHFTTLLKDALALRARLSASLAALDAQVVPEEGAAPSTPQKSAERRVLVTSGHRMGQYASFVGATRLASGRVDVCVRFPDEAMTRTYDSEYVEICS